MSTRVRNERKSSPPFVPARDSHYKSNVRNAGDWTVSKTVKEKDPRRVLIFRTKHPSGYTPFRNEIAFNVDSRQKFSNTYGLPNVVVNGRAEGEVVLTWCAIFIHDFQTIPRAITVQKYLNCARICITLCSSNSKATTIYGTISKVQSVVLENRKKKYRIFDVPH